MDTTALSEFPLFSTASTEILDWLLSVAEEEAFTPGEMIVRDEGWGRAIYCVVDGWVKIQRTYKDRTIALMIAGRGDYFGEIGIFDEPLRGAEAIALSEVTLLTLPAQRFIQSLFKEPQLHHRLLQLSVQRLHQFHRRWQWRYRTPREKLAKTLAYLADAYGQSTEKGSEILNLAPQDLADLTDLSLSELEEMTQKLQSSGWIAIDEVQGVLIVTNPRQLMHLGS
ncbi:MAG: Crp/Fnr family transcriptional regulator [Chloroflexaceae bacterium]|nr:Crp/Fnr family transcriptional regulator [Chloroflexaceae bacterium]